MPKVATRSRTKAARSGPTDAKAKKPAAASKDPKASHLYTDDNPATTIHGTGFKDKATALHTLDLISKRSTIYQFQTVNTLYNRAKHHPAMKKSAGEASESVAQIKEAMAVFREWLDETYPAEKEALRAGGFKPLLSKKVMERYLPDIEASKAVSEDAKTFARMYVELSRGKKLGNVLVDDTMPEGPDWERKRYGALDQLVSKGKEDDGEKGWKMSELWTEEREVTDGHLELIAWAWSPVKEGKLP